MKPVSPYRQANPHLGAHFGVITSGFVSLVILLAMFEQLGWAHSLLGEATILIPLCLYLAIALATRTFDIRDYFVSGRRVPPVYNGAVLAAVLVGGTGFFAYAGTLFFLGFDGLAIGLGWAAGLLAGGLLFVPYLRKAGAYTVPAFLGQRFRSRAIRVAASLHNFPPRRCCWRRRSRSPPSSPCSSCRCPMDWRWPESPSLSPSSRWSGACDR